MAINHKEQKCTGYDSGGASKQLNQTPTEEEIPPPVDIQMGESQEGEPSPAAKKCGGVTGGWGVETIQIRTYSGSNPPTVCSLV